MAYLYYSTHDVDSIELTLIPKLSELFEVKWERDIRNESIAYYTYIVDNSWKLYLSITAIITKESKCTIKQIPTGQVRMMTKLIEVEVPEFVTIIECHED